MRRSARFLLAAAVGAVLVTVAPGPASACDRHPCHTVCKPNADYIDLENGTIGNGDPIECYY